VYAGEVVALVGDNGAGKSTLVKIIAGVHPADTGTIEVEGKAVRFATPHDATRAGLSTVYQDLALAENLDVTANLFLGREEKSGLVLSEEVMEASARKVLARLGTTITDARKHVGSLSGGQRQACAIARSLLYEAKYVQLDEPTAALGVTQTRQVLGIIDSLRQQDVAVVVISHNLVDVFSIADRIVVLRLGRNAADFKVGDVDPDQVVAAMTGASTLTPVGAPMAGAEE
jgi:D-xylose transport system ATP-binding protein